MFACVEVPKTSKEVKSASKNWLYYICRAFQGSRINSFITFPSGGVPAEFENPLYNIWFTNNIWFIFVTFSTRWANFGCNLGPRWLFCPGKWNFSFYFLQILAFSLILDCDSNWSGMGGPQERSHKRVLSWESQHTLRRKRHIGLMKMISPLS